MFTTESFSIRSDDMLKGLVQQIDTRGYDSAIDNFLRERSEFRYAFRPTIYNASANITFLNISKNNKRCLEINSKWGNKSEALANIFEQVYSVESNHWYLELQRRRFDESAITNISMAKCDIFKLPFPDDFFDLVLCNDILKDVAKFSKDGKRFGSRILKELKRVINLEGRLIFGIGIMDERNSKMTYKQRIFLRREYSKTQKICKEMGLITESYWILPSYEKPYYSGPVKGKIALKSFIKNFETFIGNNLPSTNQRIIFWLLKKWDYLFGVRLVEYFIPTFIVCCGKTPPNDILVNSIMKELRYENFLMMSGTEKILFVLLDRAGNPKIKAVIRKHGNKFPPPPKIRYFPGFMIMNESEFRCEIVDWLSGSPIDTTNKEQILLAVDWLINFQNETKQDKISRNELTKDIDMIKRNLKFISDIDHEQCHKWLNEYEEFMTKNPIFTSSIHGDFFRPNILYDSKSNKINIIDWELSHKRGNPMIDIISFIYDLIIHTSDNQLDVLEKNLDTKKVIGDIKIKVEAHLGFKIDLIVLLRYYLMKKMILKNGKTLGFVQRYGAASSGLG